VVIPALTLFGNSLVVLSVWREVSLRTATNYFIVSLAVADIMVAVLVMPLAVYVEVFHHYHHHYIISGVVARGQGQFSLGQFLACRKIFFLPENTKFVVENP